MQAALPSVIAAKSKYEDIEYALGSNTVCRPQDRLGTLLEDVNCPSMLPQASNKASQKVYAMCNATFQQAHNF